jgi:hypothetical protein
MDPDIKAILDEVQMSVDVNYAMGENHQKLFQQTISNLAALRMINDDEIEKAVKN